jgi:hypothetical protein
MAKEEWFTGGFWWRGVWYSVDDNGWGSAGKPANIKPKPKMPSDQLAYVNEEEYDNAVV